MWSSYDEPFLAVVLSSTHVSGLTSSNLIEAKVLDAQSINVLSQFNLKLLSVMQKCKEHV